jgi:hypothetical protein
MKMVLMGRYLEPVPTAKNPINIGIFAKNKSGKSANNALFPEKSVL